MAFPASCGMPALLHAGGFPSSHWFKAQHEHPTPFCGGETKMTVGFSLSHSRRQLPGASLQGPPWGHPGCRGSVPWHGRSLVRAFSAHVSQGLLFGLEWGSHAVLRGGTESPRQVQLRAKAVFSYGITRAMVWKQCRAVRRGPELGPVAGARVVIQPEVPCKCVRTHECKTQLGAQTLISITWQTNHLQVHHLLFLGMRYSVSPFASVQSPRL